MLEPQRYRKRPVVIEAMQWTGDNADAITAWYVSDFTDHEFSTLDPEDATDNPVATAQIWVAANGVYAPIETGEWIIRDSRGYYPCKADVFAQTYELVDEESHA
jgi:hypothetical protein